MDIIDFHTHIFPDDLAPKAIKKLTELSDWFRNHTNGTLDGLLQSMKTNNISQSVVLPVATKSSQVSIINNNAVHNKNKNIIQFGSIYPKASDWENQLNFVISKKIKGIKLHPEYQGFTIDDKKLFPFYEALESSKLLVTFHAGKDPSPDWQDRSQPSMIYKIMKQFPKMNIIAAHLGGFYQWDEVEQTILGENIYLDTSAIANHISKDQFLRIVNKHSTDKILFGTDSPWFDQKDAIEWINSMPISDNIKELIFSKNAIKLLK